mmetsp:Transcript_11264/g.24264  ORF Transcript_11264/g.24264 Transcript_11264/m.24264 type:complete len:394 (-) Transcript_11264:610-1791(-)|eukprot:CAMPEP_0202909702 /NCGR_PEP_ID=MMETSP1392-20130828/50092_1 /ASSEMBLY_ACC=CAM_ASM_000868 /TAXON_ID=225041 /ORGANISM="Chlamydomonas chlamydogama, Strain SAG 11-48b" /LENGTH=393 /DNA_ID=CAMNT_0049599549 /DNA_START=49 /DNA_END=1230 /DNA_ORIENTATION=-
MAGGNVGRVALSSLLKHFPPVRHAFAYGSGVLHQPGLYNQDVSTSTSASKNIDAKGPMIDFIFAVEDSMQWHKQNIAKNPEHYSWLARSSYGHHVVCGIAQHVGVGVHFNTLVPLEGQMVKYGVVDAAALEDDLLTWRHLYVAGRMHKPVLTLVQDSTVLAAQQSNITSAAASALLMLPQGFSTEDLLRTICGLSYHGDVRMGVAEDPHKINRIVQGSRQLLEGMYLPLITGQAAASPAPVPAAGAAAASSPQQGVRGHGSPGEVAGVYQEGDGRWQQDMSASTRQALMRMLPSSLLHQMAYAVGLEVPESHVRIDTTQRDILDRVMASRQHDKLLAKCLRSIVARSSSYQALSGALSSGGGKALEYVGRKVIKAIKIPPGLKLPGSGGATGK